MNFSWAIDLVPKGANNQIKEAIDKRYLPDDDDNTFGVNTADMDTSASADLSDEEPMGLELVDSDVSELYWVVKLGNKSIGQVRELGTIKAEKGSLYLVGETNVFSDQVSWCKIF